MSEQPPTYQVGQVLNGHRWTGTVWEPVEAAATAPAAAAHTAQSPKKPLWKRWWVWVLVALVLLFIIAGVSGGSGSSPSSTTPTTSPSTQAPSASPSDAASSEPTQPTESTPVETPPPADPVAEARAAFDETFGTFTPIKKSGKGDSIITLPDGATSGVVTMKYTGSSNFAVAVLDSSNQSTGDLLANEIGSWAGSAAFGLRSFGGDPAKLEVTGQGSWTITVAPVSTAKQIKIPSTGKGTGVYLYVGDVADWALTHKGSSNFAVTTMTPDGSGDLLVNEIGNYSGAVPATAGPVLIEFQADGAWTIKPA
jgi:hypothetical protein